MIDAEEHGIDAHRGEDERGHEGGPQALPFFTASNEIPITPSRPNTGSLTEADGDDGAVLTGEWKIAGLVSADGFLEWQKIDAKTKQPFAIALKSGEPYAFRVYGSAGTARLRMLSCSLFSDYHRCDCGCLYTTECR